MDNLHHQAEKSEIEDIVEDYKDVFTLEYNKFCSLTKKKRKAKHNEYGEAPNSDADMRALAEYPETMHTMIEKNASEEAVEFFRTQEGQRWLCRNFPEFKVIKTI
jgi:hypothetical protein